MSSFPVFFPFPLPAQPGLCRSSRGVPHSRTRFLKLNSVDVLGQMIHCRGAGGRGLSRASFRMFSNIVGLYPLNANSNTLVVTTDYLLTMPNVPEEWGGDKMSLA